MDPSKNNGNLRADFDCQDFGVSAERAAHIMLQQRNRLLERQLAERTMQLDRSLVDVRSLTTALDAAQQRERTHLAAELHDYLAQLLVLGRMTLAQAKQTGLSPRAERFVQETEETLNNFAVPIFVMNHGKSVRARR